ncbi:hypothetical protein C5167_041395 [Papaver somniferum]|nr:hypothetical protein C5167_041395 [Papaver somniferum]
MPTATTQPLPCYHQHNHPNPEAIQFLHLPQDFKSPLVAIAPFPAFYFCLGPSSIATAQACSNIHLDSITGSLQYLNLNSNSNTINFTGSK